jgi:hypothetical protein
MSPCNPEAINYFTFVLVLDLSYLSLFISSQQQQALAVTFVGNIMT